MYYKGNVIRNKWKGLKDRLEHCNDPHIVFKKKINQPMNDWSYWFTTQLPQNKAICFSVIISIIIIIVVISVLACKTWYLYVMSLRGGFALSWVLSDPHVVIVCHKGIFDPRSAGPSDTVSKLTNVLKMYYYWNCINCCKINWRCTV